MDSTANSEVGGATAEISGHGFVDIGVGGARVLSEQRGGGYNLSGLAVAALWDLFSDPGFLDQMQTVCGKTFDSDNSLACCACEGGLAGAGCGAVDVDGASSAKPDAATIFCARHVEQVAQRPKQGHLRIGIHGFLPAVNFEGKLGHRRLPV
jgi:hypothetical protein